MKRLLPVVLALALVISLASCGKIFIRGALNTTTISGTVSVVQITTANNNGTSMTVTLVTFLQSGTASTVDFCGDQRSQFPVDQFVQASFVPGATCASVVEIIIG